MDLGILVVIGKLGHFHAERSTVKHRGPMGIKHKQIAWMMLSFIFHSVKIRTFTCQYIHDSGITFKSDGLTKIDFLSK